MTIHNSIQNTPNAGVNHSDKTVLSARQYENISCSEQLDNSKQIFQEIVFLMNMMSGYHQFVYSCFLSRPDLEKFTLSVDAIQLDIDKRLNAILEMACSV